MSRRFGYEGKPDTCLWCGKQFPPETRLVEHGYVSICCDAETTPEQHEQPMPKWRQKRGEEATEEITVHRCNACGSTNGRHLKVSHEPTGKREGYRGSQHFCTLRCGFAFAETAAKDGTRYKKKGDA